MTKRIFTNRFGLVALMSLSLFASTHALAQKRAKDNQAGPLSTIACQSTFTSGNGNSYLKFCVTQNGNIATLESPSSFNQFYGGAEGYGICNTTPEINGYSDWGRYGDTGNWADPTITQPNGPDTFPLTITRTTADGVWTLKQVFSRDTKTPAAKITMTLRNNSLIDRATRFVRFADIDADGVSGGNVFDADLSSSWGYRSYSHGVMMRAKSVPNFSGGAVVSATAQDVCDLDLQQTSPYVGDGASAYTWVYYPFPAQSSQTMSIEYRPF
jgi:hypothetical protein